MACSVALFVYMFCYDNMPSGELAEKIGITAANMSILKTGKAKMILKKISFLRGMGFE